MQLLCKSLFDTSKAVLSQGNSLSVYHDEIDTFKGMSSMDYNPLPIKKKQGHKIIPIYYRWY